uniref:Uncharacterized protein n=1 Tax=Anguilla anguilla TaxID=7936 RepID=A0A0E9RHW0_ANGAN
MKTISDVLQAQIETVDSQLQFWSSGSRWLLRAPACTWTSLFLRM